MLRLTSVRFALQIMILIFCSTNYGIDALSTTVLWMGSGGTTPAGDGSAVGAATTSQPHDITYNTISGALYWAQVSTPAIRMAASVTGTVSTYIQNGGSTVLNTAIASARVSTEMKSVSFYAPSTAVVSLYFLFNLEHMIAMSNLVTGYVSKVIGNGVATNTFNTATSCNYPFQ
eukprot:PhF_6_TR7915/c0_g1_i1/m.11800